MKKIKIILESDDKKIGYVIDTLNKSFKSCSFTSDYQEENVSQNAPIDDPKFFIRQIVSVLMGALKA